MVSNLECQVISWENCMLQLEEGHDAPWLAAIVSVVLNVQFGELLWVTRADMQCNHFVWWTALTKLDLNVFITQFIKCSYYFKFEWSLHACEDFQWSYSLFPWNVHIRCTGYSILHPSFTIQVNSACVCVLLWSEKSGGNGNLMMLPLYFAWF